MTLTTRTATAALAITAALLTTAAPATAESSLTPGDLAAATGSSALQSLFTAIGCYVGANNCGSIVIPK
ncbi:hypothetical protein ACFC06_00620 [Nocardia sp. NPDC056064]|uniref:hypothetical protein n=1 Tax=Nocardia sp. NPDC056064 TaxID=3345701 RepID=UPI0035DA4D3E